MSEQISDDSDDEWALWWNARVAAMESVLGKSDDLVGHATIPFDIGADLGGAADIIYFRNHLSGVVVATSELIGRDDQVLNQLGNYELITCHREGDEEGENWGADIISRLAHYTCESELNPGETMDIAEATPDESTTAAFLFFNYGTFKVRERDSGLLLCVGITKSELEACQKGERDFVERALKSADIFPFTDLYRESVV